MDNTFPGLAQALQQLMSTLQVLRGPEGCPWDREQTPQSLRSALLEECWELIDAIEAQRPEQLDEELGDSLLVLLLMVLAGERSLTQILQQLQRKLVQRHPHVFGGVKAETSEQALSSWHNAKFSQQQGYLLDSIPQSLPPLERAHKMQRRAARVGFDWSNSGEVAHQVEEELAEWREAENHPEEQQEELGDLLFSVINLIRFQGFDPALVLQQCNRKFYQRFCFVEEGMRQHGMPLQAQASPPARQLMEELWNLAKASTKKK